MNRSYFQVRGQRRIVSGETVTVTQHTVLRFESLAQSDAEHFATRVYREEGIICTIDEVSR